MTRKTGGHAGTGARGEAAPGDSGDGGGGGAPPPGGPGQEAPEWWRKLLRNLPNHASR